MLVNPNVNIFLGTAYLQQLLNKFQHPILAFAAYNAGERGVSQWQQTHDKKEMVMLIADPTLERNTRLSKKRDEKLYDLPISTG